MERAQLARHRQGLIQTVNCVSDNCPILLHHLDFYDRVNFPRRRAPPMMKSVAAEVMDR